MSDESKPDEIDPEVVKTEFQSAIERIRESASRKVEPDSNPEETP